MKEQMIRSIKVYRKIARLNLCTTADPNYHSPVKDKQRENALELLQVSEDALKVLRDGRSS